MEEKEKIRYETLRMTQREITNLCVICSYFLKKTKAQGFPEQRKVAQRFIEKTCE